MKTYQQLTRAEFARLLDAFADAYGAAVLSATNGSHDYGEKTIEAVDAKNALIEAVFP